MIALIAVILVAVLFYKMVFGYKMRVVGSNPWFAKACGINMTATIVCAQLFAVPWQVWAVPVRSLETMTAITGSPLPSMALTA